MVTTLSRLAARAMTSEFASSVLGTVQVYHILIFRCYVLRCDRSLSGGAPTPDRRRAEPGRGGAGWNTGVLARLRLGTRARAPLWLPHPGDVRGALGAITSSAGLHVPADRDRS